jgi:hypothetical protein
MKDAARRYPIFNLDKKHPGSSNIIQKHIRIREWLSQTPQVKVGVSQKIDDAFNSDSATHGLKLPFPFGMSDPAVYPLCSLRMYVSLAARNFIEQRKLYSTGCCR